MNDIEREQWVNNDEGLYRIWRSSRKGMREFVKENRREIDELISTVTSGKKPAHYLVYGGD